jgi:hypothetical protein
MPPDRLILDFLNRFTPQERREGELVQKDSGVTQIFGNSLFIRGRVEIDRVYRTGLFLRDGRWEGEVQPEDSQSGVALVATMLERLARGDHLPESPNEVGDAPLAGLIETRLGRGLEAREEMFVEKLQKRYRRFELDGVVRDTDLVRLNPRWPVESLDPLRLWEERPRDILGFWNCIAYAFERRGLAIPGFMQALTDTTGVAAALREWETRQAAEAWRERIRAAAGASTRREIQVPELRLMVGPTDARLQWRIDPGAPFHTAAGRGAAGELEKRVHSGDWRPDVAGALLLAQFVEYLAREDTEVFDLDHPAACRLLNRLLHHEGLRPLVVTLDETPFLRDGRSLSWACHDDGEGPDSYGLVLLGPDGGPVPHAVRCLPGAEDLYIADDTVFRGPPHWGEGTELEPRHDIPRAALECADGVGFLARIRAPLPPRLADRVVECPLEVRIRARSTRNLTTAESEHIVLDIQAIAATGRLERLGRDGWALVDAGSDEPGRIARYDRSAAEEMPRLLEECGFTFDGGLDAFRTRLTKTFPDRFHQWARNLPPGIAIAGDEVVESLLADPVQAKIRFEVDERGVDWFDLRIVVDADGTRLPPDQIRALVAARGGFVRMHDGKWLRLELQMDADQREAIMRLGLDPFDVSGEEHRLHAVQLADPAMREVFDPQAWNRICERAAGLRLRADIPLPQGLAATLRPYQVEGFHFLAYLADNGFGGILADDMGLGKTIQSLAWLLWLRARPSNAGLPSLVVCPKSVIDVWAGEAEKFAPSLRVRVLRNGEALPRGDAAGEGDLFVMNYAQLRVQAEAVEALSWLAVILDEGQQIKNPDSKAAKVARQLDARHRLVLTGTPIENRLLDLWSLMAFAMPGVLGNRGYFGRRFDRRKDTDAQARLAGRLRPFLLRRTKRQVAQDLPPRTEEDVFCSMEGRQLELYQQELHRIQSVLLGIARPADVQRNSFIILQGLMRLRQICCHPALVDADSANAESAKLNALFYLLDQLREEGHKVLVFSQFVTMLDIIRKRLEEENRPYSYLTGQTKDRREVVDHFQRTTDPNVFLLSLKAGGSGLNLTAASYVVLYDPWWNPAVENQAIDRTHRIGQTQRVNAYRLLMRDSVEQKIRVLQHQKQSLFTGVLGQEGFAQSLTLDDLRFLFEPDSEPEAPPSGRGRGRRRSS